MRYRLSSGAGRHARCWIGFMRARIEQRAWTAVVEERRFVVLMFWLWERARADAAQRGKARRPSVHARSGMARDGPRYHVTRNLS
jgi:hypothetical protein